MKRVDGVASLALAMLLAGCGGGSGDGGTPPVVVVPTPTPTPSPTPAPPSLSVVTSVASQTVEIGDDDAGTLGFDAVVANGDGQTYYGNVQYDGAQVALAEELKRDSDNRYRVRLRPAKDLPFGVYNGTVTFRLCRDTACAQVIPDTSRTFTYAMTLKVADWTTFQRNAAHTGYVRLSYDPAVFSRAWEVVPDASTTLSDIATRGDLVYVTTRNTDNTFAVQAFDSTSGQRRWLYNLGSLHSAGSPATGNGKVFVATMSISSDANPIVSINAATGGYGGATYPFAAQWSNFAAPTTFGTGLYAAAGYYGGVAYGYDTAGLTAAWIGAAKAGGISDMSTPAVDSTSVYYYAGATLAIFDRVSGAMTRSITDPFYPTGSSSFGSGFGAPIIGSRNNVMSYSGNRGPQSPSVLVNWSLADGSVAWRSGDVYSTTPALGEGVVYLARNTPARFDALSEKDGSVLWSWTPPSGETFIGNTLLSRNLVFVSTDRAIYALPTQGDSHAPVWSALDPGRMALTANGMLLIVRASRTNDPYNYTPQLLGYRTESLVAYRVR